MDPIVIPADLDVSGAEAVHDSLCQTLGPAQASEVSIDLSEGRPTQVALQLLLAAARAAEAAGHRISAGPAAAPFLNMIRRPDGAESEG